MREITGELGEKMRAREDVGSVVVCSAIIDVKIVVLGFRGKDDEDMCNYERLVK